MVKLRCLFRNASIFQTNNAGDLFFLKSACLLSWTYIEPMITVIFLVLISMASNSSAFTYIQSFKPCDGHFLLINYLNIFYVFLLLVLPVLTLFYLLPKAFNSTSRGIFFSSPIPSLSLSLSISLSLSLLPSFSISFSLFVSLADSILVSVSLSHTTRSSPLIPDSSLNSPLNHWNFCQWRKSLCAFVFVIYCK